MSECPPEHVLAALLAGHLPSEPAADANWHVVSCANCLARLATLMQAGADNVPPTAEPTPPLRSEGGSDAWDDLLGDWAPPLTFDDFQIIRQLGRGGMGRVYLGHDTVLDRPVALKFISADNPDPKALERFLLEARAIARLQHPNVVSVYRIGDVFGRPYIAYEFVSGQGLDTLPKPIAWPTALLIGLGLSRGLAAAHSRGVLHRDIKPANAILGPGGEVKLLDFGLAKLIGGAASATVEGDAAAGGAARSAIGAANALTPTRGSVLTGGGVVIGTPLYVAPELWRGSAATKRSDIFALGLLIYELCAGRLPHAGLDMEALTKQMPALELPPLRALCPDVPEVLAKVVDRCVRRAPEERFASGESAQAAFEQADAFCRAFQIRSVRTPSVRPDSAPSRVSVSLAQMGPRIEALVSRLYHRLFERDPSLRQMFAVDLSTQRVKLAVALQIAVENLHAPERLIPMLHDLGRKHARYGVKPAHFETFGRAMLDALADVEGDAWTPALAGAWRTAYAEIATAMLGGMEEAQPSTRGRASQVGAGTRTRYAPSGDVSLAYQVIGDGPIDLVVVQGWVTHLEVIWEHPAPAHLFDALAACSRLILFDQRGTGMSERDGANAPPEVRMEDLRAVMDAAGSQRAALLGIAAGMAPCAHFAATYPERTLALIGYATAARMTAGPDAPFDLSPGAMELLERDLRSRWGFPLFLDEQAPSMAGDASFRRWWATYLRLGATPGCAIRMLKAAAGVDIRHVLESIRAPALILHRTGDRTVPVADGRDVACAIPGARFVELPGDDHLPFAGNRKALIEAIQRFLAEIVASSTGSDMIPTVPRELPPKASSQGNSD